nr:TonB family protein [Pectinatus sottacetonis]
MSVPETERNNKVAAKKKRPRRYHIASLKGVNLADRIDLSNIPAKPQRIAGKKFVLPAALQSQGHSITVTVIYIIKADGTVEADIEKSSGNEAIDDAAIAAINSWQFKPMNKDYPVPIEHVFTWPDK